MGSYYVLEGPLEELLFVDASLLLIDCVMMLVPYFAVVCCGDWERLVQVCESSLLEEHKPFSMSCPNYQGASNLEYRINIAKRHT